MNKRRYFISIILFIVPLICFAQENQMQFDDEKISTENNIENTESEFDIDSLSSDEIKIILDNDVFTYYKSETEQYDTDLKKKKFKTTEEFKKLNTQIHNFSSKIRQHVFIQSLNKEKNKLSEYNIKRNGFYLYLGNNYGGDLYDAYPPKSINKILFNKLEISSEYIDSYLKKYKVFFPCPEKVGGEIEDNLDNISLKIEYNIIGKTTKNFEYINVNDFNSVGSYTITQDILLGAKLKIIIHNDSTGKDIFSYSFK